jgi:hypothetical protein
MFELKSLTRKSNSENDILETGMFVQDTRPVWCWLKKTLLALDKYVRVVHLSLVFEIPFNKFVYSFFIMNKGHAHTF